MAVQRKEWDDPQILEYNRQRLQQELARELRRYEAKYRIPSANLEIEVRAGKVPETAEVCSWIIAYHTYRDVER